MLFALHAARSFKMRSHRDELLRDRVVQVLCNGRYFVRPYSSQRATIALIRSAVRQAIARIVSEGLTPPTVGDTDPSQIQRLRMSQLRQSAFTTPVRGSLPMRAVPFKWQVSSSCTQRSQVSIARSAWVMELDRMIDQPLVSLSS
jgi:hypothetical protein